MAARKLGWSQLGKDFFCPVCPAGKVIHANVNRKPVKHNNEIGALVCGDIVGKFNVPKGTVLKTKYTHAAVFISAYGKYVHVYPLVKKSDFTAAFQHLQVTYADAGHPIRRS